jgi:hypothetical protein
LIDLLLSRWGNICTKVPQTISDSISIIAETCKAFAIEAIQVEAIFLAEPFYKTGKWRKVSKAIMEGCKKLCQGVNDNL